MKRIGLIEENHKVFPQMVSCLILVIFLLTAFISHAFSGQDSFSNFTNIILWAWERPEDLSFIDPKEVSVAFLAKTIYLCNDNVNVRPRLQPLSVPKGTELIAVVRIETRQSKRPVLSVAQKNRVVSEIIALTKMPEVIAIQIDFDAKISERTFYKDVILDVRQNLDPSIPLSITALASWCTYDRWINQLPIDEAVPMLFRMGLDSQKIQDFLLKEKTFHSSLCKNSVGISIDESFANFPKTKRIYIFSPKAWSYNTAFKIIQEVKR
jgi:hypothetical protein